MLITAEGPVVGTLSETWEGRNGKPGGSRLTVWVQQHPAGEAAPLEITVEPQHRGSFDGVGFGVRVRIMVDAQAYGRTAQRTDGSAYATGEFRCRSVGNAERLAKAA